MQNPRRSTISFTPRLTLEIPCTTLSGWFLQPRQCVYCAVRSTFYVLPTQCIYVFCVDVSINSDYFPMQNWLVSITERECVYCAVQTESLDTILVNLSTSRVKWTMLVTLHKLTNLSRSFVFPLRATVAQATTKMSLTKLRIAS